MQHAIQNHRLLDSSKRHKSPYVQSLKNLRTALNFHFWIQLAWIEILDQNFSSNNVVKFSSFGILSSQIFVDHQLAALFNAQ